MKLACDSCGRRYSIADDKVRGRTVKVRCPRCDEIIVVHGRQADVETLPEPARTGWLVILEGEQSGPFDEAAIAALVAAGHLEPASWCWREGLDDWVSLAEAGIVPTATGEQVALPAEDTVVTTTPSPTAAALTAARNDTSVLFSLADLHARTHATETSPAARDGSASGESSGLIDIRAMASRSVAPAAEAELDPVFMAGLAATPPLAAPLAAAPPSPRSRGLVVAIGGAGASLAVVLAVLVALMVRPGPADGGPEPTAVEVEAPILVAPAEAAGGEARAEAVPERHEPRGEGSAPTAEPLRGAATEAAAAAEAEAEAAAEAAAPTAEAATEGRRSRRRRARREGPAATPAAERPRQPTEAPAPGPTGGAEPPTSIEEMMERAVRADATDLEGRGATAAETEELPHRLTTAQVSRGMRRATGRVRRCARGHDDRVIVDVTIAGQTGRVTDVSVAGPLRGTAEGACVARALRGLTFPRFRDHTLQVRRYPFVVR